MVSLNNIRFFWNLFFRYLYSFSLENFWVAYSLVNILFNFFTWFLAYCFYIYYFFNFNNLANYFCSENINEFWLSFNFIYFKLILNSYFIFQYLFLFLFSILIILHIFFSVNDIFKDYIRNINYNFYLFLVYFFIFMVFKFFILFFYFNKFQNLILLFYSLILLFSLLYFFLQKKNIIFFSKSILYIFNTFLSLIIFYNIYIYIFENIKFICYFNYLNFSSFVNFLNNIEKNFLYDNIYIIIKFFLDYYLYEIYFKLFINLIIS